MTSRSDSGWHFNLLNYITIRRRGDKAQSNLQDSFIIFNFNKTNFYLQRSWSGLVYLVGLISSDIPPNPLHWLVIVDPHFLFLFWPSACFFRLYTTAFSPFFSMQALSNVFWPTYNSSFYKSNINSLLSTTFLLPNLHSNFPSPSPSILIVASSTPVILPYIYSYENQ